MTASEEGRPGPDESAHIVLRVDVERGNPTPEEIAAVVAVVSDAYVTEAAAAVAVDDARPSAWQVSARALRAPLRRDVGWGVFGG
jgi:phenylpyruvate tautomerase PptA (4-oxalocrotonate tautomerase family)